MAVHECPLCGESCCCHGAGVGSDSDRCYHACDPGAFDEPFDYESDPVGSCDDCGVNLYGEEVFDGLCDQCSWTCGHER